MSPRYYIIEHPTKGVLRADYEWDEFHWSWSSLRNDEGMARFPSVIEARHVLIRVPEKVRVKCNVRCSIPDKDTGVFWPVVYP